MLVDPLDTISERERKGDLSFNELDLGKSGSVFRNGKTAGPHTETDRAIRFLLRWHDRAACEIP